MKKFFFENLFKRSISKKLIFFAVGGLFFLFFLVLTNQLIAQCTPSSATICASGDDSTTIYVGGTLLGVFPYAGAPGTTGAANPTCISFNPVSYTHLTL